MDGFERRQVHQLSGGQQQRIALARALAIEPEVLLLDEPLSNLDPSLREDLRDQIRAIIHELAVTTVFVTHDQQEAFALADRVAIMEAGICKQVGKPDEVYNRPADRFVARFLGKANLLPGSIVGLEENRTVCVRPENVSVGKLREHTAGERRALQGTISKAVFEGPLINYTLDAGGQTISARQFHHGDKAFQPGDPVSVTIAEGRYHVLA
jgi:iron(III) transport system ATP-binding protein